MKLSRKYLVVASLLPSTTALADYVNASATDFTSCPASAPLPIDPPTQTTSLIGLNSAAIGGNGTYWQGDPDASGNHKPLGVHTWFGTLNGVSHHWLFVGTQQGIDVFDMQSGTPAKKGTIDAANGYRGVTTVNLGVTGQRILVALRDDSHVRTFKLGFTAPTAPIGASGDLDLSQPFISFFPVTSIDACGAPTDPNDPAEPGSFDVIASTTTPGQVFITNECTAATRGSLDVVDVSTPTSPVLHQRTVVDKNPTGMALSGDESKLYLTNEHAADVTKVKMNVSTVGANVGSLMTFDVTHQTSSVSVALRSAVNPGCSPVRVDVGTNYVWVTARGSNDVQVFTPAKLSSDPSHARAAVFGVGPQPVSIRIVHGNNLAVANSYRASNRNSTDPANPLGYPHPSITVFKIDVLTAMFPTGQGGKFRLEPPSCLIRGTPNGFGDFPRNIAEDDARVYVSLYGASAVKWIDNATLDTTCP